MATSTNQTQTDDTKQPRRQKLEATHGRWYLDTLPRAVPTDRILVHNNIRPTRCLGSRGFRAWLSLPNPEQFEVCPCTWASEMGQHFRLTRSLLHRMQLSVTEDHHAGQYPSRSKSCL